MLKASIPPDKQADFEAKVRTSRFPQVYRESFTSKALAAATQFKDLDDNQKKGIEEIRASYERDAVGANERLAQAITAAEADGGGDESFAFLNRMAGGDQGGESDLVKARRARRELDRNTIDKLKDLLTPSQVDRLPEREEDDRRFFGGGRRGGR
jgi:uncharacterized protein YjiS (DUF1127 family)